MVVFRVLALVLSASLLGSDGRETRVETFERVWSIVDETFYDPEFNGVDWKAVRARYAPRVAALERDEELYPLLGEMLGELKASHFGIAPPPKAPGGEIATTGSGDVGMMIRIVEGRPTVVEVDPGGPAAAAGIPAGAVVTAVGGVSLEKVIAKVESLAPKPAMRRLVARQAINGLLSGAPGSAVELSFLDGKGVSRTKTATRRETPGVLAKFGEMPAVRTRVESRRLEGGFGYVAFNIFLPQRMEDVRAAIESFRDAPGIVLDLRGNQGGVGVMAGGIAGLFVRDETLLGTLAMRQGEQRIVAFPRPEPIAAPLVVLVDEGSASASEVLAAGLQEAGRAVVVGERTAGAVLLSRVERLPNGAIFQYAFADFTTPKGVALEGRGVLPDVSVTPSRRDYLDGRDPALAAAVAYLGAHIDVKDRKGRKLSAA